MRSILTQGHAQNVRDFILNCKLDRTDARVIDFTFGTGSMWKIDYPYRCQIVKTDAAPGVTKEGERFDSTGIIKKDLTIDQYSDLGLFDAGFFDPPYLYGREGSDNSTRQKNGKNTVIPASQQGENSWASQSGGLGKFMTNETIQVFADRVKGLDRVCRQCLKVDGYLFTKVQDTRDGLLISNQKMVIDNLTSFGYLACLPYVKTGGQTWTHAWETSHGFWLVFKLLRHAKQSTLT